MNSVSGKPRSLIPTPKKSPCSHLEDIKQNANGIATYSRICFHLVYSLAENTRVIRDKIIKCKTCHRSDGFPTACLNCCHIACSRRRHFHQHVLESDHVIGCDLRNGSIYCYKCCDIIFDAELETILLACENKSNLMRLLPSEGDSTETRISRQIRNSQSSIAGKPVCALPGTTIGLRGLINLGHTCFMSCIVQAMIHTPMLKNVFLTNYIQCTAKHDEGGKKPCIVTLVCDLYQEFYSGAKEPMTLHGLVHKIWENAAHLAGYEQQDAHEFFIAMLDALHLHFNIRGARECNCIIDKIFLGKLQSSVVCTVCHHKSITVDPFWDISLDLASNDPSEVLTLKDCLNRYTRIEHLGETGRILCNYCGKNQQSTKQLQFKSLPFVLSLHLKRFEHRTSYKKIGNFVRFPELLDLSDYTSDFHDPTSLSAGSQLLQKTLFSNCRYTLYAVVTHVGSLEGGHYYAFIRHSRDEWIKCDDHLLTRATKEAVLSSPGYLLFYHKDVIPFSDKAFGPNSPKNPPTDEFETQNSQKDNSN